MHRDNTHLLIDTSLRDGLGDLDLTSGKEGFVSASGFSQAGAVPCWEGLAVGLATASVVFVVGRIKKMSDCNQSKD